MCSGVREGARRECEHKQIRIRSPRYSADSAGSESFPRLRTLSLESDRDCPFHQRMLGSGGVGSVYANPLKSKASLPGRMAQWLQSASASAEVWVKFFLALVGLGLAFATALFSTVSRDAGNLWATLILASTSLALATLVGLVTVPYLARRVAVERLRESFDYDVTRAGIVYVLVTLVIGIAALNP